MLALPLYIRHLRCNHPQMFSERGPLLLACNHPNSFLDAIILCTLFRRPVYSLARGDVFKKNWAATLLRSLRILPVYRTSEGAENLGENYKTFEACLSIFRQGGIVLIFSEGLCENEWHLRPLKKGTARLALSAWQQGIPLRILPVALNYSSFKQYGKSMHIFFGAIFSQEVVPTGQLQGRQILAFNKRLQAGLQPMVYELDPADKPRLKALFERPLSTPLKFLNGLPALLGYILHWPVHAIANAITQARARESGHYDSIVIGLMFFIYPIYLALIAWLVFALTDSALSLSIFILLPLLARCTLLARRMVK